MKVLSPDSLLDEIKRRPSCYLIGVSGIPGSGKSTLAKSLCSALPGSALLPMDGYHLPRCRLDEEGRKRRGAPWTFDHRRLHEDLLRLKQEHGGSFPDFDHAAKDPNEGAILVTPSHRLVIVEGLYLLFEEWGLSGLFDLTVFIECDLDVAMKRLAQRHVECRLEPDLERAKLRIAQNDLLNAETILHDGCANRADVIIPTTPH